MLVYGDQTRRAETRRLLDDLGEDLRQAAALPPGLARHAAWVAGLVAAGELAQGIADANFAAAGDRDAPSPAQDAAMALLLHLAAILRRSWEGGFAEDGAATAAPETELRALRDAAGLPEAIRARRAEGFAHYALYPEAYLRAGLDSGLGPPLRVIGLRSIGAPLAAMVAAATGATAPVVTLRPVGHPFRRRLSFAPALETALLAADPAARFAVVDEGPGLSGSSFGAVMDLLEDRGGVAPGRIHLFPGHGGAPGPQADPRHRRRWAAAARHVVSFDALALQAPRPEHRLESWVAGLIGPVTAPLREISGGAWRTLRYAQEAEWPPVQAQQERRKFLARTGDGATWLLKFAGLGPAAEAGLARARALQAAGLTPPVAGRRHGFLVERWMEAARPLAPARHDRERMVQAVGRYLGFRATRFPAAPESGASLRELAAMARHNATEAGLGEAAERWRARWGEAALARLEAGLRRVVTDNRMQVWEWLVLPGGGLLKADALDHHAGHDLVGCQDIAWDIAGAAEELELGPAETARLAEVVAAETGGRATDPALLALLRVCYLAFRLGQDSLGAESMGGWPEEAARLRAAAARTGARLRAALAE